MSHMSPFRLSLRSARYFWKMNLAVACGAAVGTAVLTGALLVGDSMQGSLRDLALGGLGRIDDVLVTPRLFREQLAVEGESPAILLRVRTEKADERPPVFANQVNLIGCDERFWQLGNRKAVQPPKAAEIVLNEPLAKLLGVQVGDAVIVRLPRSAAIPAESALGQKRDTVGSVRLKVSDILAAQGLGRFSLRPSQRAPRNAYMSLAALQQQLEEPGRANAIFRANGAKAQAEWHPQLADYGIHVEASSLGYLNVGSEQMIFAPAMERAILANLGDLAVQPTLTYLANTIACGKREIPYSTIAALDFVAEPPLGPFLSMEGKPVAKLAQNEIALNAWAADRLKARLGDTIVLKFFEPESIHGKVHERTAEFRLAAVVQLSGAAADAQFTPTVRGLTDKQSIQDWDPPFPFDARRVHPDDDRYWKQYRATPKAFVSLAAGRMLWASRFGQTTSLRVCPAEGMTADSFRSRLELDPTEQGFAFQPIRQQVLSASEGTTPFGGLFLAFSIFVIAAAAMLVVLLFRLGVERRAKQLGLLLALGFRRRQVARILLCEGFVVALTGSMVGATAGVGYAALMLLGLRTWWLPAIGTPFLTLHVTAISPAAGFISGLLTAMIAIWFSVRRIARLAPRTLLAGATASSVPSAKYQVHRSSLILHSFLLLLAIAPAIVLLCLPLSEDARLGAFFSAGAISLISLLTLVYLRLRAGATGAAVSLGRGNLLRLALRNAARNPGRSALAIGLTASACFSIASVSAFRVDPTHTANDKTSGSGGFSLVGQTDHPIYHDLNTPEGRAELGVANDDEPILAACKFYAFRMKPGDDASCLNLYQPHQPRLLGVPASFIERGGFGWAEAPSDRSNPWQVLGRSLHDTGPPTPMVLDQTTANYALNLWKGCGESYTINDARGSVLSLQVAGLLQDSLFQGDLLVGENDLIRYDPTAAGYCYFLIETPPGKVIEVQQALQRTLGDYGFTAETTADRLAVLAGVQNTYLAAFQSLGGLGLLLGMIGLAVVQWRNVLERRGELALLRATGFSARSLAATIVLESLLLLILGLGVGLLAAVVAVLPHIVGHGTTLPIASLAGIFMLVFVAGILASLLATNSMMRTPILKALREDK